MTKTTKTVWKDGAGHDILEAEEEGKFYTPINFYTREQLTALVEAAQDALTTKPEELCTNKARHDHVLPGDAALFETKKTPWATNP